MIHSFIHPIQAEEFKQSESKVLTVWFFDFLRGFSRFSHCIAAASQRGKQTVVLNVI